MSSYAAKVSAAIILLKDSGGSSLQAIKKQLQATKTQYRFINAAIKKGVSSGHLTKHGGKYKVKLDKAKTAKVERVQPKQVKEESTATSKKASSSKKRSSKKTSSKKASSKTQSKTSKKSKSTKLKLTSVEKAEQKRNKAEAKAKTKAEKALVKARKKALKTSRRPMITIKVAGVSFKKAGIKKVVRKLGEVMVEDRFSAPHVVTLKREPSNPYDSNASKPIDWSNGRCPPANPSKGQIILGYAHKNNTCGMGGNVSCIKANIGDSDKDGNDDYLEKEINLCEF